ncbi:30S ribosomal protein S18 [Candidatus Dependentiae bacterium]|nr:30S ribosomal protein S18 [Candidatus Dependentiae bacterium]
MVRRVKLKISSRVLKKKTRRGTFAGPKHCRFCANDENARMLDYKNSGLLRNFITERGKILPSRISGCCARHQRTLTAEIKNARIMALLPFVATRF